MMSWASSFMTCLVGSIFKFIHSSGELSSVQMMKLLKVSASRVWPVCLMHVPSLYENSYVES